MSNEYGHFGKQLAHRYAYLIFVGPIPSGLVVDHVCGNTLCVNPRHLQAITNGDNIRKAPTYKRRSNCRAGHPLTPGNIYTLNRLTKSGRPATRCRECFLTNQQKRRAS